MPFKARTMEAIRDDFLAALQARYASPTGDTVKVDKGSHYWMLGEVLGLELAGQEAGLEALTQQLLPDKADGDMLARHGAVEGLTQEPATAAVLTFAITGAPSTSSAIGSSTLVATNGLSFAPPTGANASTNGSGTGTVSATCQTPGAAGTLPLGTVVQWSTAPTGINATAMVTAITTAGEDEESPDAYAQRIIDHIQARPAGFNAAEVREIVRAYAGVDEAFVYSLLEPVSGSAGVPGTFTVLAIGPVAKDALGVANGDSPTNTRFIGTPGAENTGVKDYIEGTRTAAGVAITDGSGIQLRPCTMLAGNYRVESPSRTLQNVTLNVTVSAANKPTWVGAPLVTASTTNTVTVNGDWSAIIVPGSLVLAYVGTSAFRGGVQMGKVSTVHYDVPTTSTTITFESGLAAAPTVGVAISSAPGNYDAMRKAILAVFDKLGPGDAGSPSQRFPGIEKAPATLTLAALIRAAMGVEGVLNASVGFPVSDVTPAAKTMLDLGTFGVVPS
jgi:uncharacterized phage protein gp47/JayE